MPNKITDDSQADDVEQSQMIVRNERAIFAQCSQSHFNETEPVGRDLSGAKHFKSWLLI
jgi:hypothetical protein